MNEVKNNDDFWKEIEDQFGPMQRVDRPVYVLSPAQARRYQLADLRVPKFRHLLERPEDLTKSIIVNRSLFEKNFDEWLLLGLINNDGLEKKYLEKFPPAHMWQYATWKEINDELGDLIMERTLSKRFAELWSLFNRRNLMMLFLDYFDPYSAAAKSSQGNESSEMERYIYAIWMHSHRYTGRRGQKQSLVVDLAHELYAIIETFPLEQERPWPYVHYEALLATKAQGHPLIRTVTDMTPEEIYEYATDGAFVKSDFPELFSLT